MEEFITLVEEMRIAQKEYFRFRSIEHLHKAKLLEKKVDEKIKQFTHGISKLFEL